MGNLPLMLARASWPAGKMQGVGGMEQLHKSEASRGEALESSSFVLE